MRICEITGCNNELLARGMCNKHWIRWSKGTSLTEKSMHERTPEENFWMRAKKQSGNKCWLWMGSTRGKNKCRYGMLRVNGKYESAHRFSWIFHIGPIPKTVGSDYRGTCVLHRCDNPSCVNPRHLFLGTHTDNMRDKIFKGRDPNKKKTHCPSGHKYSTKNTYITKKGLRMCRECHRIREANRRSRMRAGG